MYLLKLQNVFVQIDKYICPNEMHLEISDDDETRLGGMVATR